MRADTQGVFVFRFELPDALNLLNRTAAMPPDGKILVIFRLNFKDLATLFLAQNFPVKNKDVLCVSNASAAELQKFFNAVVKVVCQIVNIGSAIKCHFYN
ncbi:MAG: hypothetical protein Q7U12_08810 [Undibacterium sp.]|nr:hypothetical protein [Undibacterium sp.]